MRCVVASLFLAFSLSLLAGCGQSQTSQATGASASPPQTGFSATNKQAKKVRTVTD
jgi:uncharacterized lipoprotein YajG